LATDDVGQTLAPERAPIGKSVAVKQASTGSTTGSGGMFTVMRTSRAPRHIATSDQTGKITLKHGPAKSLGMDEGMTMVYRVKDPAMLKEVKLGDKVKFEAEDAASGHTVTKLQKVK